MILPWFIFTFFACRCVWYTCIIVHLHVDRYMWPHTCVHVCEAGTQWQVSSLVTFHFIFWGKVSHLNQEFTDSAILASQLAEYSILYLPNTEVATPTQSKLFLTLNGKHFTDWAMSPASCSLDLIDCCMESYLKFLIPGRQCPNLTCFSIPALDTRCSVNYTMSNCMLNATILS